MIFCSQDPSLQPVHSEGSSDCICRVSSRGHHGHQEERAARGLVHGHTCSNAYSYQILVGHRNNVTCLAKSNNGTYLASGDVGPDQHSVFVWSVISKKPVLKMTNPHGSHGVEALQFTAADRWLVTVGGSSSHQSVCLWDWKNSPESPISCVPMKAGKVKIFKT